MSKMPPKVFSGKISLYGAVPIKVGDKELVSLTGSATIYEILGKKYLVDLGMFQGGEGSELFNKENVGFLNDIDGVIITHSHIDHIGRLPLLYKYGYRGPIYMTSEVKEITNLMLLDSLKIQEGDKIETLNRNKKLGFRIKEALKIKSYLFSLGKNGSIDKKEKRSIVSFLVDVLGTEYEEGDVLSQIDLYLDFYDVKSEKDINTVLAKLKDNLFDLDDIEGVMGLTQSVEQGEEKILSSKKIKSKNNNLINQELLNNLPKEINKGYVGNVSVSTRSEKRFLKKKWTFSLEKEIDSIIRSDINIENERELLIKDINKAYNFIEQYKFLYLKTGDKKNINFDQFKNKEEYRGIKKQLNKYKLLLKSYGIDNREDITRFVNDDKKLIDLLRIGISFNSEDIDKATHLLSVDNISDHEREIIGMVFSNAGHIVGSSSVTFTAGKVKKQVNDLIDINNSTTSFLSGDLGRINDNRLARPEIPPLATNYLQIESTYGGKDHTPRTEAVNNLINEIEDSKGNVLIATFSQQRTAEILLTIMEEKIKRGIDCLDYEILVDAPLAEKIGEIYIKYEGKVYNLLDVDTQYKIFGKQIFRFLGEGEWEDIYSEKEEIKLTEKEQLKELNKIYKREVKDNELLRIPDEIELSFSNVPKEVLEIYNENQKKKKNTSKQKKKYIILASSGMMDGGAITNHLPEILSDKDATLIAPGYLSEGTIGNKIVIQGDKSVTISGTKIKVRCNSKFIDGFSSHIGHSEILQYITECINQGKLKKGATIALTHGSRKGQEILEKDIRETLDYFDRKDVKITIPDLFSKYDIIDKKFDFEKKNIEESQLFVNLKKKKVLKTPDFLLGKVIENKYKSEKELKFENVVNSEELKNIKNTNFKLIDEAKDSLSALAVDEQGIIDTYFSKVFSKENTTNTFFDDLGHLSSWQQKKFYELVGMQLNHRRKLKNYISSFNNNIAEIPNVYNELLSYVKIEQNIIKDEIIDFENKKKLIIKKLYTIQDTLNNLENGNRTEEDIISLAALKKRINNYRKKLNSIEKKKSELEEILDSTIDERKKNIEASNIRLSKALEILLVEKKDNENEIRSQKGNKADEKVIKGFMDKVKTLRQEIKANDTKLEYIKNEISTKYYFIRKLKAVIPSDFHSELELLLTEVLKDYTPEVEEALSSFIEKVLLSTKDSISVYNELLIDDIHFKSTERKENFKGLNLYKEIFGDDPNGFALDKLKFYVSDNFIEQGFYTEEELILIKESISLISSSDSKKKDIIKANRWLKSFFKKKQDENKNLGVNSDIDVGLLYTSCLDVLSRLFTKKYYSDYILPHFNVYLFLKSKKTFKEYIHDKYNLWCLSGIDNEIQKNKKDDELLYQEKRLSNVLTGLSFDNEKVNELSTLDDINFLIEATIGEIDDLVSKNK